MLLFWFYWVLAFIFKQEKKNIYVWTVRIGPMDAKEMVECVWGAHYHHLRQRKRVNKNSEYRFVDQNHRLFGKEFVCSNAVVSLMLYTSMSMERHWNYYYYHKAHVAVNVYNKIHPTGNHCRVSLLFQNKCSCSVTISISIFHNLQNKIVIMFDCG